MPDMLFYRRATASDLADIAVIEKIAGFNHWNKTQLAESLNNHVVYVSEIEGVICGFSIFSSVIDEAELLNIVVIPQYQGRSIGKGLLCHGITDLSQQDIKTCFLEVATSNTGAIHLYRKVGFTDIALRKNYYQGLNGSEDAIVMRLILENASCLS